MRVLIVEDENIAAQNLASMINDIDENYQISAIIDSVQDASIWLLENSVDLIFMDIQLSDGLCFEIFDKIEINTPVIFTTAYDSFTLKAFKYNSIDYLLKPIKFSDLKSGISKFSKLNANKSIDFRNLIDTINKQNVKYKERFVIQIGDKIKKVDEGQIAYFYAKDKTVYLRTYEGSNFPMDISLDKLELVLNPELFYRINRQLIVKMGSIISMTAYSRGRVKLELIPPFDDDNDSIVSIDKSAGFKKWLNGGL